MQDLSKAKPLTAFPATLSPSPEPLSLKPWTERKSEVMGRRPCWELMGRRAKHWGADMWPLMGGCWNETLDWGSSLVLAQPGGPERCRAGATSLEGAGCQHRDWGRDTALAWQKLSVPVPALSQAAAEQGPGADSECECPWGTPGGRGTQASQCWDSHPNGSCNSLPCPVELCFPSLSSKEG